MNETFWQQKSLTEMSEDEWESLCDGCGQCCLNKLIDAESDEIYFTNVACNQLNLHSCQCSHYETRHEYEPDCIKLTQKNLLEFAWLPETCAYRLLSENKGLPDWHPLIAGNSKKMHKLGISVRKYAVHEINIVNWEDHILNKNKESD